MPFVRVRSGTKDFSNITDFENDIERSGVYIAEHYGNHVLYTPRDENVNYCLKKSRIWIDDEAKAKVYIKNKVNNWPKSKPSESCRYVSLHEWSCIETETDGVYDIWMCIERVGKVKKSECIDVCISVCKLLSAYDGIHNNINPHNIFFYGNNVILGNPGLLGSKNEVIYYTAPEILHGKTATQCSDVYSLGIWLYEMFRNEEKSIFASRDRYGITDDDIKRGIKGDELSNIIIKAVNCNPEKRYKNPEELRQVLEKVQEKNPAKTKKVLKTIGITAASVIAVGAIVWYGLSIYDPGAKVIRGYIASSCYSLAYDEICERESNEATDELIIEYISGCMDVLDYQRAAQIIPEFSQSMFDSPEYLESLFNEFKSKGKINVLESILPQISSRSEAIAEVIDKIK